MLEMTAQCMYDPLAGEVHLETVIKDLQERFESPGTLDKP